MGSREDIEEGLSQMNFEMVDNGVLTLPTSTPATYAFVGDATPNIDELKKELDEYDFALFDTNCKTREDGQFYCHFEVVTDHYKRIKVKAWNETVNLFPKEELPDTFEFSRIIHAIEAAFGSEIEHKQE